MRRDGGAAPARAEKRSDHFGFQPAPAAIISATSQLMDAANRAMRFFTRITSS